MPRDSIEEKSLMTFIKSVFAITALFALLCAGAHASGSGEVTREGKTTKLANAYAYRRVDHFDAKKKLTVVVFSTEPAETAKVNAAADRIRELESQLDHKRATYVEIEIASDGSVQQLGLQAPGLSTSGGSMDKPVLARNDGQRIEGSFRTTDEKKKTSGFGAYYDLKFALDIPQ
jgi:hypothetical protein